MLRSVQYKWRVASKCRSIRRHSANDRLLQHLSATHFIPRMLKSRLHYEGFSKSVCCLDRVGQGLPCNLPRTHPACFGHLERHKILSHCEKRIVVEHTNLPRSFQRRCGAISKLSTNLPASECFRARKWKSREVQRQKWQQDDACHVPNAEVSGMRQRTREVPELNETLYLTRNTSDGARPWPQVCSFPETSNSSSVPVCFSQHVLWQNLQLLRQRILLRKCANAPYAALFLHILAKFSTLKARSGICRAGFSLEMCSAKETGHLVVDRAIMRACDLWS